MLYLDRPATQWGWISSVTAWLPPAVTQVWPHRSVQRPTGPSKNLGLRVTWSSRPAPPTYPAPPCPAFQLQPRHSPRCPRCPPCPVGLPPARRRAAPASHSTSRRRDKRVCFDRDITRHQQRIGVAGARGRGGGALRPSQRQAGAKRRVAALASPPWRARSGRLRLPLPRSAAGLPQVCRPRLRFLREIPPDQRGLGATRSHSDPLVEAGA